MAQNDTPVKALVLAGGGARGSYQVGVWRALTELGWRPQIITGTSVGSLNRATPALDRYETARDMWLTGRSQAVMELPADAVRPAPDIESAIDSGCILGLGSVGERMLILLDIEKLMGNVDMGLVASEA